MATSAKNFTINKNLTNEFIITIKQDDSILPMIIDPTDTFRLFLIDLDTDSVKSTIDMDEQDADGYINVYDYNNGRIKIVMNPSLTNTLRKERGPKEDRYYRRPTYKIAIECNTVNNGNFVAKLDEVTVD